VALVGGEGARLGDLAATMPKPLVPIDAEAAFLDEVLRNIGPRAASFILARASDQSETLPGPSGCAGSAPRPIRPRVPDSSNALRSQSSSEKHGCRHSGSAYGG